MSITSTCQRAALVAMFVALLATTARAQALNVPIAAGFDPLLNPSPGGFSLLETTTPYPNYTPLTQQIGVTIKINTIASTTPGWWASLLHDVPVFFAHTGGGNWTEQPCCGLIHLPNNTLFFHPGHGGIDGVVRYSVPAQNNGRPFKAARIQYRLTDVDYNGGDGVSWHIDHNGATLPGASGALFSTNPLSLATTGNQVSVTFPVATGDFIDFVVDAGPNGDENYDTTALKGTIHLIP